MDMSQYLEIFIEESKEHLQNMNQSLLELENNHKDIGLLNEIFRIAHTLKGMAGTMGYNKITSLTHEMENVLQALRSEEIQINEVTINILFECFDVLDGFVNQIVSSGEEGHYDTSDLIYRLKNHPILLDNKEDNRLPSADDHQIDIEVEEFSQSTILKAIKEGYKPYKIQVRLNDNCMLKSARAFIVFNTLEKVSEIIKSNPPVEDIEDEKFENYFEIIIISKQHAKLIKDSILSISEIDSVLMEEIEVGSFSDYSSLNDEESMNDYLDEAKDESATDNNENDKRTDKLKKPKIGKTVRVDIDRLDNLMNLVSELIIIKTRLEDIEDKHQKSNMNEAIEYLERITTNLHDAVMKVRMVSIERVFNRFPRMIRDLSKELGKEISLMMAGEKTEVDRTVIDEIGDPLIHLLRNAIDHGIEDAETRKKLGKSEIGSVKLIAYPDGNSVVIEVEDDGQGINIDKVKAKAIQKGLISKEQANSMDNREAVHLLFKPGFSTTEKISDISGRGVGLDVVKTKIESLGGVVEIETIRNMGSTFIIRLPLTLAIIQALLVNVGYEKYAIPLNSIKEIITIGNSNIRKIHQQEVVLYRNTTLPILRMDKILNVKSLELNKEESTVVVVKKGEKVAGFVVDNLIGQQEIVIKSLGKFLSGIKVIAGATILGNGQVALIVDTNSLF